MSKAMEGLSKGAVPPMTLIENWIEKTLTHSLRGQNLNYFGKATQKLGIDRDNLLRLGIAKDKQDRIYRSFFVYTMGMHDLINEFKASDFAYPLVEVPELGYTGISSNNFAINNFSNNNSSSYGNSNSAENKGRKSFSPHDSSRIGTANTSNSSNNNNTSTSPKQNLRMDDPSDDYYSNFDSNEIFHLQLWDVFMRLLEACDPNNVKNYSIFLRQRYDYFLTESLLEYKNTLLEAKKQCKQLSMNSVENDITMSNHKYTHTIESIMNTTLRDNNICLKEQMEQRLLAEQLRVRKLEESLFTSQQQLKESIELLSTIIISENNLKLANKELVEQNRILSKEMKHVASRNRESNNILDNAVEDRNSYKKQLEEIVSDSEKQKKQLQLNYHEINGLKETISVLERELTGSRQEVKSLVDSAIDLMQVLSIATSTIQQNKKTSVALEEQLSSELNAFSSKNFKLTQSIDYNAINLSRGLEVPSGYHDEIAVEEISKIFRSIEIDLTLFVTASTSPEKAHSNPLIPNKSGYTSTLPNETLQNTYQNGKESLRRRLSEDENELNAISTLTAFPPVTKSEQPNLIFNDSIDFAAIEVNSATEQLGSHTVSAKVQEELRPEVIEASTHTPIKSNTEEVDDNYLSQNESTVAGNELLSSGTMDYSNKTSTLVQEIVDGIKRYSNRYTNYLSHYQSDVWINNNYVVLIKYVRNLVTAFKSIEADKILIVDQQRKLIATNVVMQIYSDHVIALRQEVSILKDDIDKMRQSFSESEVTISNHCKTIEVLKVYEEKYKALEVKFRQLIDHYRKLIDTKNEMEKRLHNEATLQAEVIDLRAFKIKSESELAMLSAELVEKNTYLKYLQSEMHDLTSKYNAVSTKSSGYTVLFEGLSRQLVKVEKLILTSVNAHLAGKPADVLDICREKEMIKEKSDRIDSTIHDEKAVSEAGKPGGDKVDDPVEFLKSLITDMKYQTNSAVSEEEKKYTLFVAECILRQEDNVKKLIADGDVQFKQNEEIVTLQKEIVALKAFYSKEQRRLLAHYEEQIKTALSLGKDSEKSGKSGIIASGIISLLEAEK